jgi:hypothetical protein
MPVEVREENGEVSWYPSRDIVPVVFDDDASGANASQGTP